MFRRVLVVAALALSACASSGDGATVRSVDAVVAANAQPDTSTSTGDSQVGGSDAIRLSSDECTIAVRTLETAIEAYFADYQVEITSADDLVTAGYLLELYDQFDIDFSADVPRPVPVTGGPCDYDFRANFETGREAEADANGQLECWMDLIAAEAAVRGYTVAVGSAPTSFEDVASIYVDVPTEWATVELSPDGQVVDLVPGGCGLDGVGKTFGPEWADAPPACAIDAWTLGWALFLIDADGVADFGPAELIDAGLILPRDYYYDVVDGSLEPVDGSGCPSITQDDPDETARADADACQVEQRTLETAAEAFFAVHQRPPVSIDELVDAEFLLDGTDHWVLTTAPDAMTPDAASMSFEPVPGGRCDPAT